MSGVSSLSSGEIEFVDERVREVCRNESDEFELTVLIRPVSSRGVFLEAVRRDGVGYDWEELGYESVVGVVSVGEIEELLDLEVIEAIEVDGPVELLG